MADSSDEEDFIQKLEEELKNPPMDRKDDSDDGIGETPHSDDDGAKLLDGAERGNLVEMGKILQERPELINYQDPDGYTALHRAAYSEKPESVKFLLRAGASVHTKSTDGWTPLHSAARWNSSKCVNLLLQNGADPNALTNGGLTPSHIAAENAIAHETLILLLLNPRTDPDIKNPSGETGEVIAGQHGSYSYLFELARKSINNI